MSYPRRTPVHAPQQALSPTWGERFGMTVALRFADPDQESRRFADLALADLSALPRLGIKGPAAEAFLASHGGPAPATIYDWRQTEDGALVIRVDSREFLIEDGLVGGLVGKLAAALGFGRDGAYRVERQDCSVLISGPRALEVFAQTCGVDVAGIGDAFFKTRVALTSCAVKRNDIGEVQAFRLWFDPSYGEYLYSALLEIIRELGGGPVGWECVEHAAGVRR